LTRDSLAVAIEALSWMAYSGIGERTALLKASSQLNIQGIGELRQAHKWIMETSRFQNRLDWVIAQAVPDDIVKVAPHGIRSLLRILAYMKVVDSKPRADLEKTVSWGRQVIGWGDLRPYEEHIARLVSTTQDPLTSRTSEFEKLAVDTCHPAWYVQKLVTNFGRPFALEILRRDLFRVGTFARANSLKMSRDRSIETTLGAVQIDGLDEVYSIIKPARGSERAKLASNGEIVIQDLGSIVVGLVASPSPGDVVLDICASPGNKTSHLAAQMRNEGEIYSIELSRTRCLQWKKEMNRTGCSIATLIRGDARKLPLRIQGKVVVVDPPCSNSGVFARNPASKWRVTPVRLKELVRSQEEILQAASQAVIEGGTLVYCTCSVLPEEDEYIVETFLRKNPEFDLVQQAPFLGRQGLRGLSLCQRFYPCFHDCNGSFIAKMRKG